MEIKVGECCVGLSPLDTEDSYKYKLENGLIIKQEKKMTLDEWLMTLDEEEPE
ncbi:hypothetical protein JQN58_01530 [Aneurinibacillus sp. BA2021]|nr:hypothetical protein [Aneurinibacillus sp. BA2021]